MLKILLADDEKTEREGLRYLIEKYEMPLIVEEACNGKAALEYIEKNNDVDILLTDVKMPYMDGLELAKRVNEFNPDIVTIIFSAYGEFEYAKKACEANAVNYLLKPIEVDEFKAVMDRVMDICAKKQQQKKQSRYLMESNKKLWLYRLINSRDSFEETAKVLRLQYDINLENKYLCLISVETRDNYFERNEDQFEEILKKNLKTGYETINLYPNLSYILLYSSHSMDNDLTEEAVRRIYAALTDNSGEMFSVIVGTGFYGMKQFRGKLQELEEALKNTFSYFSGVIYLAKTNFKDAAAVEEQLQMKESVIRSIEDKNLAAVREQMVIYLNRLEQEKSSSAFYVKYLVVDIVKAIFQAYGFYKETIIWQTAGDIMNCDDLQSVSRVLERVIDEMTENGEEPLPDVSAAVAAIKKVVKNEYMNDIGLEEIAEKVSLTPSYVSFIFKKETGNNLVKYLTDYRMKKAKELLEESNKKIGDIGRLCGYQNPSYFNKLFKNYYGVTPKQYREK